eukprot:TRINITY_DN1829_c0_g1_i1.p1 TRINITY_DN1829_c0_g1~~TRINITY_DN1829_c0_g1_i1.p1  ORF type:complete len:566 (-),score=116.99 TRINITY_DN1829_c0_g1_i1:376-2073(-)
MTAKPDSTAALAHIIKAPMRKALVAMKAAALGHIMDVGVDSIKLESDRFITKLKAENARLTSQITEARAGIHNASRVAVQHRAAVRAATLLNEVSEQRFLLEQRANDLALQLQQIKFQAEDLAARLPESTNNILDMKDSIAEAEGELAQTESESRHLAALLHKMSRQKDVRDVRLASLRQSADAQRRDAEFLNHTCGQAQTDLQHTNNELLEIQNDIDEQRRNAEHVIAERQRQLTHQQELIQQYLQQRSRAHSNVDAVGLGLDGDALMDRYAVAFKRLREICNTDTVDAILQRLQRQKDIEVEYTTKRGAVTQRAAALAEEKEEMLQRLEEIKYSGTVSESNNRALGRVEVLIQTARQRLEDVSEEVAAQNKQLQLISLGLLNMLLPFDIVKGVDALPTQLSDVTVDGLIQILESRVQKLMTALESPPSPRKVTALGQRASISHGQYNRRVSLQQDRQHSPEDTAAKAEDVTNTRAQVKQAADDTVRLHLPALIVTEPTPPQAIALQRLTGSTNAEQVDSGSDDDVPPSDRDDISSFLPPIVEHWNGPQRTSYNLYASKTSDTQ